MYIMIWCYTNEIELMFWETQLPLSLTQHPKLSAALRAPGGELHVSAHVRGRLAERQSVDQAHVLQMDPGAGLQRLALQTPPRGLGSRGGHLAFEGGVIGGHDLHIPQLSDH